MKLAYSSKSSLKKISMMLAVMILLSSMCTVAFAAQHYFTFTIRIATNNNTAFKPVKGTALLEVRANTYNTALTSVINSKATYHIEIYKSPAGISPVYKSPKIVADGKYNAFYVNFPESRNYYVKVVIDNAPNTSDWKVDGFGTIKW